MRKELVLVLAILAFLIAHFGTWVAFYNRTNAMDLPRRLTKPLMKLSLLLAILFPLYLVFFQSRTLGFGHLLEGRFGEVPLFLRLYYGFIFSSYLWLGIAWIYTRPFLRIGWVDAQVDSKQYDVQVETGECLTLSPKCAVFAKIPWNQIFQLSVEQITLPVRGLPSQLDGYRIAHLSDIHLTGDVAPEFTQHVINVANAWSPELFALTGDLIDSEHCVEWIHPIFAAATAVDGAYFILGNHDARMKDVNWIRESMRGAGWVDLGGQKRSVTLRGQEVTLLGNESPWLKEPPLLDRSDCDFRLMLSHSPDQIRWARNHNVQLMLAGHTHGGQGRLPLLGPILSPSLYGSRFASGQFYHDPTTMHVTRGLGGTRLLRLNCPPELSLLTLRSM